MKELAILWQGKGFLFPQKTMSLSEWLLDIYHFCFAEIFKGQRVWLAEWMTEQFVLWRTVSSCGVSLCAVQNKIIASKLENPPWTNPELHNWELEFILCWRECFYYLKEICLKKNSILLSVLEVGLPQLHICCNLADWNLEGAPRLHNRAYQLLSTMLPKERPWSRSTLKRLISRKRFRPTTMRILTRGKSQMQ